MGTRSLIKVIDSNGNKKVAQYCQWDGSPDYMGVKIMAYITNKAFMAKFKSALSNVILLDNEQANEFIPDIHNMTKLLEKAYNTYLSRDLGSKILLNIAESNGSVYLFDKEKESERYIKYSYVINIQENTFEIYAYEFNGLILKYSLDAIPNYADYISQLKEAVGVDLSEL